MTRNAFKINSKARLISFVIGLLLTLFVPVHAENAWIPPSAELPIFYVTDRKPEFVEGKKKFGKMRRDHNACHYGISNVLVSWSNDSPPIEGALWNMGWRGSNQKLGKSKAGAPPIARMKSIESITDKRLFFKKVKGLVELSDSKQLVVFVHGYNNSFESVTESAARLEYYFKCPVLVFSWPSQNELLKYTYDECNAEWSSPDFRLLLRDLEDSEIGPQNISLIGHSMGNRLLMWNLVSRADLYRNEPKHFKAIVLSSPDLDSGTFKMWSAFMRTNSDSNWVFISHKDVPLRLSRGVHGNQRAGHIDKLPKVPGVDLEWKYPDVAYGFAAIDFSKIDKGPIGHSIPYSNIQSIVDRKMPADGYQWKELQADNRRWYELVNK